MVDLNAIDVEELTSALADQTDYDHRWLIDPRSGEIVFWTSDGRAAVRAVRWLADGGIVDDDAAQHFYRDDPEAQLP